MKIAVLTNNEVSKPLIEWLKEMGENVTVIGDRIDLTLVDKIKPDLIVIYSYKYLIPDDVIKMMDDGIINLHISYLPWNKGADPDIWSFLDNTPKGVTIHKADQGMNTGDILIQEEIVLNESEETLLSSYTKLHDALFDMFKSNWKYLRERRIIPSKQKKGGSVHKSAELDRFRHIIEDKGLTISIKEFKKLCAETE